jgi:mRNA interferase MazF
MRRGDLYRVRSPRGDPRRSRVFVVVGRQAAIDSAFSTVICAPIFSAGLGIATQVPVGPAEGLKHESWILCDGLVSIDKAQLTDYIGGLSSQKLVDLNRALRVALDLP